MPFEPMPWQVDFIRQLYGTLNPDGLRQYRQGPVIPAKKERQNSPGSSIGLVPLLADGKPGAEVYLAAGSDQAVCVLIGCGLREK